MVGWSIPTGGSGATTAAPCLPDSDRAAMVARMSQDGLRFALLALALLLNGCGLDVRADAAKGIVSFLDAVHRGDRPAFEAALDRPALRADLRAQLVGLGRARALDVDGGPSEFALDRMITPRAIKLVEAHTGQAASRSPTAAQIAPTLKVADRRRVCVSDPGRGRCLLTFAKEKGAWRLVGMQATDLKVQLPPDPKARRP